MEHLQELLDLVEYEKGIKDYTFNKKDGVKIKIENKKKDSKYKSISSKGF